MTKVIEATVIYVARTSALSARESRLHMMRKQNSLEERRGREFSNGVQGELTSEYVENMDTVHGAGSEQAGDPKGGEEMSDTGMEEHRSLIQPADSHPVVRSTTTSFPTLVGGVIDHLVVTPIVNALVTSIVAPFAPTPPVHEEQLRGQLIPDRRRAGKLDRMMEISLRAGVNRMNQLRPARSGQERLFNITYSSSFGNRHQDRDGWVVFR